ncbi:MAG: hypothetical protein IKS22_00335 [Bacteroidales bacterium]|nr:hypothetical protein [Bacteroidales bacterium]
MITELDGRTVFSETLGYDSHSNSLGGPSYTGLITRKGETWTIPTGQSPSVPVRFQDGGLRVRLRRETVSVG